MTSWRLVSLLFKLTYSPCLWGHNDIVESFIAMQIIFAEIFVPQDFTIRLLLGSVWAQICVWHLKLKQHLLLPRHMVQVRLGNFNMISQVIIIGEHARQ